MTLSTYICLCGILVCLAALAAMKARHICRDVWRSFTGRRGAFAALAAFAVVATICAQKPGPTPVITVDAFLRDAGCYATNDVLHVAVTNAPAYAGIDFSSCPVLVYARPRGLSDAPEWEELLPRRTFSELPADYAIEDATNYNYLVYLDYVPPSPVHTNGVFELRGFMVPGDEPGNLEQLAAGFINSRAIIPPPTARDYVQDGLIAVWDGIDHGNDPLIWRDLSGNGYDATQRVANAGWRWDGDCYRGTLRNSHGFRAPQALVDFFRSNITNHTVEIVYRPTASSRETILGQYSGSAVGLNIEYAPHLAGYFRVYWGASPDFNSPAWKTLGMVRMTTTMLCNGTNCQIYENGAYKAQAAQPNVDRVGVQSLIIGGENSRPNMSICGELCIVRIYSRALSADEIRHNYEIDKERFNLP